MEITTSTAPVGQRHVLDGALEELDIGRARLGRIRAGQGEHLVGHVDAVGEAGRTDPPSREQHVDAAARTRGRGPVLPPEVGHRHRVAASQARRDRLGRQLTLLVRAVEAGAERSRPPAPIPPRTTRRQHDVGLAAAAAADGCAAPIVVDHREGIVDRSRSPPIAAAAYRCRTCSRMISSAGHGRLLRSIELRCDQTIADASTFVNDVSTLAAWQHSWIALPVFEPDAFAPAAAPSPAASLDDGRAERARAICSRLSATRPGSACSPSSPHMPAAEACVCDLTDTRRAVPADGVPPPQAARRGGSHHPRTAREVGLLPGRTGRVGQSCRLSSRADELTEWDMRRGSGPISPATARANDIGVVWVLRWAMRLSARLLDGGGSNERLVDGGRGRRER